jgi:signal peptidase I
LWLSAGCATAVILALVLGVVALRTTFRRLEIRGESMAPTLVKGDGVLTRPAQAIRRGDIVLYLSPKKDDRFLHRVVGLPGESISMRDDVVFINGMPLDEPYAWFDEERLPGIRNFGPIRLPADSFFILGDNRDNSNDSRYLGTIPRDHIRSRVVYVISPRSGLWKP